MRNLTVAGSALLLAGGLFAQQYGSGTGFGNIIYPGTGRPPLNPRAPGFGNVAFPGGAPHTSTFSITDPNFARNLQNNVSGRVPYTGGHGGGRGRGSTVYAYPVFLGGYDYGFQQQEQQAQQPNVTVVYPQPQPPVVINQNFQTAQPSVQEYGPASRETSGIPVYQAPLRSAEEVEAAAAQASQPYYLIAFKDHSIYSAIAYWVDGETLHYFTSGTTHNQVSMGLVDKELTDRLNRERKVDIRLK